jgi:hypothetical protein
MSKMEVESADVVETGEPPVQIVTHLSERWAATQEAAAAKPQASGFICGECGADNNMSVKDAVRCKMWYVFVSCALVLSLRCVLVLPH